MTDSELLFGSTVLILPALILQKVMLFQSSLPPVYEPLLGEAAFSGRDVLFIIDHHSRVRA